MLLYSRNSHNIVNRLYSDFKKTGHLRLGKKKGNLNNEVLAKL